MEPATTKFDQSPMVGVEARPKPWMTALMMALVFGPSVIILGLVCWIDRIQGGSLVIWLGVVFTLSCLPVTIPWLRRTLRYEITPDALVVIRAKPFKDILVPFSEIEAVTRPVPSRSQMNLRVEAAPMVAPLKGLTVPIPGSDRIVIIRQDVIDYRLGVVGIRIYGAVTDPHNLVLIQGERNFLLSPERPDEFAECLRTAIENAARSAT